MRRTDLIYRNSLRPATMINITLVVAFLVLMGVAHSLLGVRHRAKLDQGAEIEREIARIKSEADEVQLDIDRRLSVRALDLDFAQGRISLRPITVETLVDVSAMLAADEGTGGSR